MIDDASFRIGQSELLQVRQLQRFRNLVAEATATVDDAHALALKVRQIVEGIKNAVAQTALPRRRTHAVKEQRIFPFRRSHIIVVVPGINLQPWHSAFRSSSC